MDTIQKQSIDQNSRILAETAGFSDIYNKTTADILKILRTTYI